MTYIRRFLEQLHAKWQTLAVDNDGAFLRVELKDGRNVDYRGVSLIETEGESIKAFRTYYDSAAFVVPVGA